MQAVSVAPRDTSLLSQTVTLPPVKIKIVMSWKKGSEWWANYIEDGVEDVRTLYKKLIQGKVSEES